MVLVTEIYSSGSQQWLPFLIWSIVTLFYKMRQILLQNTTAIILQNAWAFLLQNTTAIMLQNAWAFLLQNATVITKCDSYYKMRRLLQNASI